MLNLALPFASGAKPVSSAIARKSYKERPSAREGGLASSPACMKDLSALDIDVEVMASGGFGSRRVKKLISIKSGPVALALPNSMNSQE